MSAPKPVRRSDGKLYASLSDAANSLMVEWGVKPSPDRTYSMARNITKAINGEGRTAFGYEWEPGPTYEELLGELKRKDKMLQSAYEEIGRLKDA